MHDLYELKMEIKRLLKTDGGLKLIDSIDQSTQNLIVSSELIAKKIYAEKTKHFISGINIIASRRLEGSNSKYHINCF